MPLRRFSLIRGLALVIACMALAGCDFDSPSTTGTGSGGTPVTPGGGGGPLESPILFGLEPTSVCVGDSVTLTGVNFSQDLDSNEVNFIAGVVRIPGLPTRVETVSDNNAANGLETRLYVRVPGGVSPGNVELIVNGVFAGASGYESCPQLMAYTIARNEQGRYLRHQGPLGFEQGTYLRLYGTGFVEIQEVVLEDSLGGLAKIFPNALERNPVTAGGGVVTQTVPTGYSSIGFTLKDDTTSIQLGVSTTRRDNVRVWIVTAGGVSNALEVPALNYQLPVSPLGFGAALNGVKVPTGVVTGSVRIYYNIYDVSDLVNTPYNIEVEWSTEGGTWFTALPDATDPEYSGNAGVLPGTILHGSQHRLFPGAGATRCFVWDATRDVEFVKANTPQSGKPFPPREWEIQFRIRPVPKAKDSKPINHVVVTPKIQYLYLENRSTSDSIASERSKALEESFINNEREDTRDPRKTTASWGPPNNDDALVGCLSIPATAQDRYGNGTADLTLIPVPQEDLSEDIIDQWYSIDTDEVWILQHFLSEIVVDPTTNPPTVERNEFVNLIDFQNPGKAAKEFHMKRLRVTGGRVLVTGANPVVFRFSGPSPAEIGQPDADRCFTIDSGAYIDLNGQAGADGPTSQPCPPGGGAPGGAGGAAVAGGGAGGNGGPINANPYVQEAQHGTAGGNYGGEGGETTAAYDVEGTTAASNIPGGPGGGGGHRLPGGDGYSGNPAPARFSPPRAGRGGVARGEAEVHVLTGGSGGGGGGGSPITTDGLCWTAEGGAGGGGGGGVFSVTANGYISIEPGCSIQCNGGRGGNGRRGGAGGGGSGGMIVLRARLDVDVDCTSLQVGGGLHGTSGSENDQKKAPGSGDGAPGWVRIESETGGVPTCSALQAFSTLTANLGAKELAKIDVASTAGFPERGTVVVEDEQIGYLRVGATTLEVLTRTKPVQHNQGASVYLMGAIGPYADPDVWVEKKVLSSPDQFDIGRGRDGELHLRYAPGTDLATGEPTTDPDTGEVIAVYQFDTDLGVITDPLERVILEVATSETDPGFLDLGRLLIDQGTHLRCFGSHAARISILDQGDIAGTIDASGEAGGLLVFSNDNLSYPVPGVGGRGGPGGGAGGGGGTTIFRNGDVTDKSEENVVPVNASPGGPIPGLPPGYDMTPVPYGGGNPEDDLVPPGVGGSPPFYTRALPGLSTPAKKCGQAGQPPCIGSAGGGGGGGSLRPGQDGASLSLDEDYAGKGSSAFGLDSFRFGGEYWEYGGLGGSGGGADPHTSAAYQAGISGSYLFKQQAKYAPGTGGGGGGGALIIVAKNLLLRETCKILARGGDAYQTIDLGGNGGAGGGGNVFIRVRNSFTVEQGALIDVAGGRPNRALSPEPGKNMARYEGNIRTVNNNLQTFGGKGGAGAPGRVRIEADQDSLALRIGLNYSVSSGRFLEDSYSTVAHSTNVRLGVGPGSVAKTPLMVLQPGITEYFAYGQPVGTQSVVLWEAAQESLEQHGAPGTFLQLIRDAEKLRYREFVRFTVYFDSNRTTGETQSIDTITLPFYLIGRDD